MEKAIQTSAGIIICATEEMKKAGNFDSAVGTFEKYIQHLKPLCNQLTAPLLIIGIDAPKTFRINPKTKTVDDIAEGYTDYVIWNRFRPECLDIDGDLPMECVDSGMVLLKGDIHDILGKVLNYAYGQIAPGAIPLLW